VSFVERRPLARRAIRTSRKLRNIFAQYETKLNLLHEFSEKFKEIYMNFQRHKISMQVALINILIYLEVNAKKYVPISLRKRT
jgi:hypothetical protein